MRSTSKGERGSIESHSGGHVYDATWRLPMAPVDRASQVPCARFRCDRSTINSLALARVCRSIDCHREVVSRSVLGNQRHGWALAHVTTLLPCRGNHTGTNLSQRFKLPHPRRTRCTQSQNCSTANHESIANALLDYSCAILQIDKGDFSWTSSLIALRQLEDKRVITPPDVDDRPDGEWSSRDRGVNRQCIGLVCCKHSTNDTK